MVEVNRLLTMIYVDQKDGNNNGLPSRNTENADCCCLLLVLTEDGMSPISPSTGVRVLPLVFGCIC